MNVKILNRDFQHPGDGWYQIESKGRHPNAAAGVVQLIDDDATAAIVNRFNADAAAGKLRHGHELLIDHEHFSDQPDQETRAYGWLTKLENRADGIYGQIRWTTTGKSAVDGGDYRFFSTEYDPADLKIVNDGKTKQVRPLALAGLTLTNMNNNRGQKPITNREEAAPPNIPGAVAPGGSEQTTKGNKMKLVLTELGLSPDAAEDVARAEVIKLKNRIAALEPVGAENETLKTRNNELEGDQVETLMDAHGMKPDAPARTALKPVLVGLKNRADRVAFLKECITVVPEKTAPLQTQLRNRDTKPPGAAVTSAPDEKTTALKISNRAEELTGKGGKFGDNFARATREFYAGQIK